MKFNTYKKRFLKKCDDQFHADSSIRATKKIKALKLQNSMETVSNVEL